MACGKTVKCLYGLPSWDNWKTKRTHLNLTTKTNTTHVGDFMPLSIDYAYNNYLHILSKLTLMVTRTFSNMQIHFVTMDLVRNNYASWWEFKPEFYPELQSLTRPYLQDVPPAHKQKHVTLSSTSHGHTYTHTHTTHTHRTQKHTHYTWHTHTLHTHTQTLCVCKNGCAGKCVCMRARVRVCVWTDQSPNRGPHTRKTSTICSSPS